MKETNAIITSVLWTGKNPKEIERFCHKMGLDSFLQREAYISRLI